MMEYNDLVACPETTKADPSKVFAVFPSRR